MLHWLVACVCADQDVKAYYVNYTLFVFSRGLTRVTWSPAVHGSKQAHNDGTTAARRLV